MYTVVTWPVPSGSLILCLLNNRVPKCGVMSCDVPHCAQIGFLSPDAPPQLYLARQCPCGQHSGADVTDRESPTVPAGPGVQSECLTDFDR